MNIKIAANSVSNAIGNVLLVLVDLKMSAKAVMVIVFFKNLAVLKKIVKLGNI